MSESTGSSGVHYRALLTDAALISVFFASGIGIFGNNAMLPALPAIGTAFRLTEAEIGLIMSVFNIGVIIMLPAGSMLADMYGRRPVVITSLLVFGFSGLAMLWVTSFEVLLILRVLNGMAFAGTAPISTTLIGDLYTGPEGSSAQGIRSGINGIAGAIAPIIGGALAVIAWQYPFALFATAIPVAGLIYWFYTEPIEPRKRSQDNENNQSGFRNYWRTIWNAADRNLGLLLAGGFTLFFLKAGFKTFLPVFVVQELGVTATTAGILLGVYGGTRAVIAPLSGLGVSRFGRKLTMIIAVSFAAVGMGVIPFASTVWVVGIGAVLYSIGEAILNPVLNDAVAAFATDEYRAAMMGGLFIFKTVPYIIAPVLIGGIIGAMGYTIAFVFTAVIGLSYGLVMIRLNYDQ